MCATELPASIDVVVAYPQLELDRQLCFPLYAASRAMIRSYAPSLDAVGLTYPQYLTMLALWEADGSATVGGLGRRLHLDSGTLTPLLKRLETAGYVERRRDPDDERRVIVDLTAAGADLQQRVAGVPATVAGQLDLSPAEGVALHTLLQRVLHALDADASPGDGADR
jgi:DNA-binding MarR family transcriptional regulator